MSVEEEEWAGEFAGEAGRLVLKNPIGTYYGGRNAKNERHGRGRTELPSGDLYLGCYYKGKRHGLGVYRYKNGNGARYGGDWYLGVKSGWGTMYFPDASQYTGCWAMGRIHGWGTYVYPNGDEYEGWWYMGYKNGRGIYRTKKSGEKFVGNWIMGLRQGKGQIIRKEHRFIGNWYNDSPRGPGVYVFPDLGVEQHGLYTMFKLKEESVEKYKTLGHQVLSIRKDAPPLDPVQLEAQTRQKLLIEQEIAGEIDPCEYPGEAGDFVPADAEWLKPPKKFNIMEKSTEQIFEERLADQMQKMLEEEKMREATERMPVVPMWRVIQITRLITPIPDETVPPPPIPETPLPLEEPPEDEGLTEEEKQRICKEQGEDEARSLMLARCHELKEPYTGGGSCQLNLASINWPDDCPLMVKCSQMSFSNLDDLKNLVQSVIDQPLEPIDFEKIVAQNLHLFKASGMDICDRWRECLGNETECYQPAVKGAPDNEGRKSQEPRLSNSKRLSQQEKRPSQQEKRLSQQEKRPSQQEKRSSRDEKRPSQQEKRPSKEEKRISLPEKSQAELKRISNLSDKSYLSRKASTKDSPHLHASQLSLQKMPSMDEILDKTKNFINKLD